MYTNVVTVILDAASERIPSTQDVQLYVRWAAPCENVSLGICGQRRPRSDCASAQSDQGLHCPLTESLGNTECMNREQRRGYFAHAQDDLNLRVLCMCQGISSLDAACMIQKRRV